MLLAEAFVALGLMARTVNANTPYLVKDINTFPGGSASRAYVQAGDAIFFSAYDYAHGRELWRTDGTAEGTVLVKDILPGSDGSDPGDLTELDGSLLFSAWDEFHGEELWRSNGTEQGTVLVKDINPGQPFESSNPWDLMNLNGIVLFAARDGVHGWELWRTDGTEAGTVLVKDICPGGCSAFPWYADPTKVGDTLFFAANDGEHGIELWKSDGTEEGTALVKDIRPGSEGSLSFNTVRLINVDGTLFLSADDGASGIELWKSDGTEEGTVLVKDIRPGPEASFSAVYGWYLANAKGRLYFAADDGVAGREPWISDGTEAGTTLLKDVWPGDHDGYPYPMTAVGETAFFVADDAEHGYEPWKTDGTTQGTVLVKDIRPGGFGGISRLAPPAANLNGTLVFTANNQGVDHELWKSDGTEQDTVLLKDIWPGDEGAFWLPDTGQFRVVDDKLFFTAREPTHGVEPWISDGTEDGTVNLCDINVGTADAILEQLTPFANLLFFTVDPEEYAFHSEFWVSDGSSAGTTPFEILPGHVESSPSDFTEFAGRLFFSAYVRQEYGWELWSTDGSEDGTALVKDIYPGSSSSYPHGLIVSSETLFFAASDGQVGVELWKSDGSEPGTTLVMDINPGADGSISSTGFDAFDAAGTLFFVAEDGVNGIELWRTDGSDGGAILVKDINPGAADAFWASSAYHTAPFVRWSGVVLFAPNDGEHGRELWRTDGTEAGTTLVKDVCPGPDFGLSWWTQFAALEETVVFTAYDDEHGLEVWRTDATETGTVLVKDIWPGPGYGLDEFEGFTFFAGMVFFRANDGVHGEELWVTDGTPEGTFLFSDLRPGILSSFPDDLTVADGALYFSADDGAWGREVWVCEGTPEETYRLSDIAPESAGAYPSQFTPVGDRLFFAANDSFTGNELWAMDLPGSIPGDLNDDGCVGHADLGIFLSDWGCSGGDCPGDCDGDGDTDHSDLAILLAHWGEGCP